MYNRYIPQPEPYTPAERPRRPADGPEHGDGLKGLKGLLERLRPQGLDSGDVLLILVALLLWKDSEDTDLLLALAAAFLLGDEGGKPPER